MSFIDIDDDFDFDELGAGFNSKWYLDIGFDNKWCGSSPFVKDEYSNEYDEDDSFLDGDENYD